MKGQWASLTLVMSMGISGLCLADDALKISHEQAAIEASFNLKLANRLWQESNTACLAGSSPHLLQIIKTVDLQSAAQPTNHLNYSARSVFSGCRAMLSDVAFVSGACLNKQPTKHEVDHARLNWEKDSAQCMAEIDRPDIKLSEDTKAQSEADIEARLRKEGVPEADIAFIKELRKL